MGDGDVALLVREAAPHVLFQVGDRQEDDVGREEQGVGDRH
jgi:hypothetical protein